MAEMSNALRHKLGSLQKEGLLHPDADLLTAFAERTILEKERAQVLAHLASCRECREVVALSMPELPELEQQPVLTLAPVSLWRRLFSPVFGLAALGVIVAASAIVLLQGPARSGGGEKLSQAAPAAPSAQDKKAAQPQAESAPVKEGASPSREADSLSADSSLAVVPKPSVPRNARANVVIASTRQPVLTAGKRDFINTSLFDVDENYQPPAPGNMSVNGLVAGGLPAAPQPQPAKSEARFNVRAPEITMFSDIPSGQPATVPAARVLTPSSPPDHLPWVLGRVMQKGVKRMRGLAPGAAPAITSGGIAFSAMGDQAKFRTDLQKQQPTELAAAPEKADTGGLDRFESLSRRTMFAGDVASEESPAAWKVVGGKLVKSTKPAEWEEAYPGAGFQFTFVSARGNEVWAGGTHAAVIHSRDGGAKWESPRLGPEASGSIVSILFSGGNIQIKTSDDQSWSSADGGKTWTLSAQN